MRIHLTTTPNKGIIHFDYQQKLIGTLHKWIGDNDIHDKISLYSFSWLQNGNLATNGYNFRNGAKWFISFYDETYIKKIVRTILADPDMFLGLQVKDVTLQDVPDFSEQEYFKLASPVFIKRQLADKSSKYYTYDDKEAGSLLVETLKHKMQIAGLPEDNTLDIRFDVSYQNKKVKMTSIHGIGIKGSMCPVFIQGKPETKAFAWSVGLGNMTGAGFGSLY